MASDDLSGHTVFVVFPFSLKVVITSISLVTEPKLNLVHLCEFVNS